ncbi:DELTA-thalatoxin-Avl1a-like [Centroberyx gerrardi]
MFSTVPTGTTPAPSAGQEPEKPRSSRCLIMSKEVPTHRECTVEIENGCSNFILCNPREYYKSGSCGKALPLTLGPSASATSLFTKTTFSLRGAVGVFTYDLHNNRTNKSTDKIAVMFSVPFDYTLYSNWYAVGIFDLSKSCDEKLFCEMYSNVEQRCFIRGKAGDSGLTYKNHDITIEATMTDTYEPVMKVQVNDKSNE